MSPKKETFQKGNSLEKTLFFRGDVSFWGGTPNLERQGLNVSSVSTIFLGEQKTFEKAVISRVDPSHLTLIML